MDHQTAEYRDQKEYGVNLLIVLGLGQNSPSTDFLASQYQKMQHINTDGQPVQNDCLIE